MCRSGLVEPGSRRWERGLLLRRLWPRRKRQLVGEDTQAGEPTMRSIVLWAIGIPIPIILLLAFCTHHL